MTGEHLKKHPCPDCRMCQQCGPSRCHVCRGEKSRGPESGFAHMSMEDQIRHFEALNQSRRGVKNSSRNGETFPPNAK